jgi:hypothetical protein
MTTPWHRAYVRSRRDALTDTVQTEVEKRRGKKKAPEGAFEAYSFITTY